MPVLSSPRLQRPIGKAWHCWQGLETPRWGWARWHSWRPRPNPRHGEAGSQLVISGFLRRSCICSIRAFFFLSFFFFQLERFSLVSRVRRGSRSFASPRRRSRSRSRRGSAGIRTHPPAGTGAGFTALLGLCSRLGVGPEEGRAFGRPAHSRIVPGFPYGKPGKREWFGLHRGGAGFACTPPLATQARVWVPVGCSSRLPRFCECSV